MKIETKEYSDGSSATGPALLPEVSPIDQQQKAEIRALPLNGFAPTNEDIAEHLIDQSEVVRIGAYGDLRNAYIVIETVDGRLIRQTCGAPCDLARAIGVLTMAAAQAATEE